MRILTQTTDAPTEARPTIDPCNWTHVLRIDHRIWTHCTGRIEQFLRTINVDPADTRVVLARPVWAARLRAAWVAAGAPSPLPQCLALGALLNSAPETQTVSVQGTVASLSQRLRPRLKSLGIAAAAQGLQFALADEVAQLAVERAQSEWMHGGAAPEAVDGDGSWFWQEAGRVPDDLAAARAWGALPETACAGCAALIIVGTADDADWASTLSRHARERGLPVCSVLLQPEGPLARRLAGLLAPEPTATPRRLEGRAERVMRQRLVWHESAQLQDQAQAVAGFAQSLWNATAGSRVAIVAFDHTLARQVNALLRRGGVPVRDDTGWPLSTTRAAGALRALTDAAEPDADSQAWLDLLRQPGVSAAVGLPAGALDALEQRLRREGLRFAEQWHRDPASASLATRLASQFAVWRGRPAQRSPQAWAQALHDLATGAGLLRAENEDPAWLAIAAQLDALRYDPRDLPELQRTAFLTLWRRGLEQTPFHVQTTADVSAIHIVSLGDAGMQPWDWCLLAGPDAGNLPAARVLPGRLTATQRQALGLRTPQSERARAARQLVGLLGMARRLVVFERIADEATAPSPLIDLLAWGGGGRGNRLALPSQPLLDPDLPGSRPASAAPSASQALPEKLTASGYVALRNCPYQFFGRSVLRLREADDLEDTFDKRDYGVLLHGLLEQFHLRRGHVPTPQDDAELLDAVAAEVLDALPAAAEPFRAVWPQVRAQYLDWLPRWAAEGWQAATTECALSIALADLDGEAGGPVLQGRLDRIDARPPRDDGESPSICGLDYKTQATQTLRERSREWAEDTQLLFYSLLLRQRTPDARELAVGYLRIGERAQERVEWLPLDDLAEQGADFLVQLRRDWTALERGASMPAIGEEPECGRCEQRGLCRRDWRLAPADGADV